MKLGQLIQQYITYRHSLGEKFRTNATYLRAFCKFIGEMTEVTAITEKMTKSYLYQPLGKKVTSAWFVKHTALLGFFQYALTRGYTTGIPLPMDLPKRPEPFVPYIYSKDELKRLFATA